jgi:hypothetical protein
MSRSPAAEFVAFASFTHPYTLRYGGPGGVGVDEKLAMELFDEVRWKDGLSHPPQVTLRHF